MGNSKELIKVLDTRIQYDEINNFGYKASGLIIEAGSLFEININHAIALYFCNDDNKLDDCMGFVQESSFKHRLNYYKAIIEMLDRPLLSKPLRFQYLQKNERHKAKTIIEALDSFNALRNKFAHNTITPLIHKSKEELIFNLEEFKPRNNKGNKKEHPVNVTVNDFSESHLLSLQMDIYLIYDCINEVYSIIKNSCKRISAK